MLPLWLCSRFVVSIETDTVLSYLPSCLVYQVAFFNIGASVGFFRGDPTLLVEDMLVRCDVRYGCCAIAVSYA